MIIEDNLLKELINLQGEIYAFIKSNKRTNEQVEKMLRNLEKRRFNILNEIKIYNNKIKDENNKIHTLDNRYIATYSNDTLRLFIPETMPKFKQINNFTYKRILLNISEITKPYSQAFLDGVFIYIKIYDNQTNWDVDNKFIKPISDRVNSIKSNQ